MRVKLNSLFFLIAVPLILLVGFRGWTPDTQTYFNIFKQIDSYDLFSYSGFYADSQVELGWGLYSKVISYFTQSSIVLFSIFSFFTFWLIYRLDNILNISFIHTLAFYVPSTFFLMQQFMQIRQGLAIPAVMLASFLFIDNKKKEAIIFFIIAI
ncbi:EpsG family protein, partial [uncultured Acinetobacter sp.]|uniref:EpsG family protein n=1 Tax=uncultured Acinetobacter sp. TaxID=165433 RepID=UPI0025D6949C